MINAISIALSGLNSSVQRLNASASNIANLHTTGSLEEGEKAPYNALTTTSKSISVDGGEGAGVITDVVPKDRPFVPAFDPNSPFANEEGLIGVPNVNLAEEAVNSKLAALNYKANLQTIKIAAEIEDDLLDTLNKKV